MLQQVCFPELLHIFIIIPSYSSLTPARTHLCPIPKEEKQFSSKFGSE